jgi:hypothetical protein
MSDILARWRRAAQRAQDEKVRILEIDGQYRATSSSRPLGSYRLWRTPEGWVCECPASYEHGKPCKHLWALSELLDLDVLADVRIDWDDVEDAAKEPVSPHAAA